MKGGYTPKALQIVQEHYGCAFSIWKKRLTITQREIIGTCYIQIDVLAIHHQSNRLLMIECKDSLSIQALTECAAQLKLKCFLLCNYVSFPVLDILQKSDLDRYQVLQNICIGSHSGSGYKVAKYDPSTFQRKMEFYQNHVNITLNKAIGLIAIGDDYNVYFNPANPMAIL